MQIAQPYLQLADGSATYMGEGIFVITQRDELGAAHHVVVSRDDLQRLLVAVD